MNLAATMEATVLGERCRWFVGFTKPRQERRAAENLTRQGFDCRIPLIRVRRRIRREVLWQEEPMFPRYLFLRPATSAAPLECVRSTLGMSGLVRFAGLPATVTDGVVSKLLGMGNAHREDLFTAGEIVRFVEGPLAGLEGVFERADGDARSIVLLEFLQRQQRVAVSSQMLEAAIWRRGDRAAGGFSA